MFFSLSPALRVLSLGAVAWVLFGCSAPAWQSHGPAYPDPRFGYGTYYDPGIYRDPRYGYPSAAIDREEWERRQRWLRQQERELAAEKARLERERRELRREQRKAAERQQLQQQQTKSQQPDTKPDAEKKASGKVKPSEEPSP